MLIEAENVSDIDGASRGLPEIALLLEENILKGSLSFKKGGARGETVDKNEEVTPKRERAILSYAIDGETYLQMHAAASLVRSLAGLDIYLKYFAHSGDILIIDEPEMNAHPDAQLMIMELLAILANSGITVVITTHSPYIVDHLNNLIAASTLPAVAQDTIASHCKLNRKDAFIGGDSVATYLFTEQGTVEDIFDRTQTIIDLSSFSDTSNYVTNLYAKILESRQGFSCDEDKDSNDGA